MRKEKKQRILYFIQLPPPVHGVSVTNQLVYNSTLINEFYEKKLVRINFSKSIDDLRKFSFKKLWILIRTISDLKLTLLRFRPDLVYFSLIPVGPGFLRDAIFALTIKMFNRNVVFHLNNRGIPKCIIKPLYRKLYKWVFNNSNIIHVSNGLIQSEIAPLKLKKAKVFAVGNTIEPFNIANENRSSPIVQFLFLSNYFPEKGLMVLLEAMLLLKKKTSAFKLDTYGAIQSKEEDFRIRKFVQDNNLEKNVNIHGPIFDEEKIKVLENADVFIFPSYFEEECFPLSILEAMNAKLPILATKIGAIPEMLEDNYEGLLVDPKCPEQILEKLETLIMDVDLRKKLGDNTFKKFKEHYSIPIFENKMRSIFESVIHDTRH